MLWSRFNETMVLLTAMGLVSEGFAGLALDAIDHGHYLSSGAHIATSLNYSVGDAGSPTLFRNFFIFDLSALPGPAITAQLHLLNPDNGFFSNDATETYTLFDVTTDPALLMSGVNGLATYNDLGSGSSFGSHIASNADNGTTVVIPLNAQGIASINSSLSGLWAVGGAITSLDGVASEEFLFAFTGDLPLSSTQLVVTVVPAPGAALALLGLAGFAAPSRRRGS